MTFYRIDRAPADRASCHQLARGNGRPETVQELVIARGNDRPEIDQELVIAPGNDRPETVQELVIDRGSDRPETGQESVGHETDDWALTLAGIKETAATKRRTKKLLNFDMLFWVCYNAMYFPLTLEKNLYKKKGGNL